MIQLVTNYIRQAKEIAQHFTFYNPQGSDQVYGELLSDHPFERSSSSGIDTSSNESLNKDDSNAFEEERNPSQFTLVNSSQMDIIQSASPGADQENDEVSEKDLDELVENQKPSSLTLDTSEQTTQSFISADVNISGAVYANESDIGSTQHKAKIERKISWAANMATIIDEHLSDETEDIDEQEDIATIEKIQLEPDTDFLLDDVSEAGSLHETPIYNTPTTEYLDFEEVSRQMQELDSQLNQSESFYAQKCVIYWEARGWLEQMEANEYDEEMLISMERHKRILLNMVKIRLENEARDRANRELLFKVQNCCRELAEREATPVTETPKSESIIIRITKNMITTSVNWAKSLVSYSFCGAKNAYFIGKDVTSSTLTFVTELKNVVLGEDFSFLEFQSKFTVQDLLDIQKDIPNQEDDRSLVDTQNQNA